MPVKPTSVTLDDETRARLDRIAGTYERSRSWLIGRAVREYLDREEAYVRAVEEGIEAADQGRLVPHDQVMAEMDALIEDLASKPSDPE
jgi:predicted transcriptional regulator